MTFGRAAMDGIRLAFTVGILLAITNGTWARFNKGRTLAQSVDATLNKSTGGGVA